MSCAPVYRSLSVAPPPTLPSASGAPSSAPIVPFTPLHSEVVRASAQSPVRMVTERDLLKRVLRKQFDTTFMQHQRTPERWASWIDQRWAGLSRSEQQVFSAECERINTAARCSEARRDSPVPQLCGPM